MLLGALFCLGLSLASATPWTKGWCDSKHADTLLEVTPEMEALVGAMDNPDNNLPTPDMIARAGYPVETYQAYTEDGYILTLHRIPYGKNNKDDPPLGSPRPVVFVQHGLLCSSADWVLADPVKGLGYILADAGYDVWLGNFRGNTYSRNHMTLDPDHQRSGFWDFTWDEIAKYDLPAMIEKALQISGQPDLLYAGHSMGSTTYMILHKYRPDIVEKVRLANFLSPIAYMGNAQGLLPWIASLEKLLGNLLIDLMGVGEFLPSNLLMDCIATLFCQEGSIMQGFCSNILFMLVGFDSPQMNKTLTSAIMHHTPAGASTRTLLHYAQEINSGRFEGYDWGSKQKNEQHHGTETPPVYDLKDVTTPLAIHWGDNDWLAAPSDLIRVIMDIPNILPGMNHEIQLPSWNHLDFLWAIDADKYVYSKLLDDLMYCTENDCRAMVK